MRCPSCMAENTATRRFCGQCGAPLPWPCPACSFENEPATRFCGGCGRPLGETAAPTPPAVSPPPHTDGAELRQLTVMFCDLVGSTALASRLDPEDLREVIGAYHREIADVVRTFDGFIAKFMIRNRCKRALVWQPASRSSATSLAQGLPRNRR
jgi:hypothetical protein